MLHACGITSSLISRPASTARRLDDAVDADTIPGDAATSSSSLWWQRCATGDIKVLPEDFVVVEIDPTGQRTDANPYVFPAVDAFNSTTSARDTNPTEAADLDDDGGEVAHECGNSVGDVSLLCKSVAAEAVAPPSTRALHDLHRLLVECAPTLRQLFGDATEVEEKVSATFTQADLTALIRDAHLSAQGVLPSSSSKTKDGAATPEATTTASSSATETFPWWRGSHCLGEFAEKKERQIVHLLVRRCFPHMRSYAAISGASTAASSSSPSVDDVASVLSCSLDLHYVLFCATLGAEAALCIARWAIAAQSARQERSLDAATRREMQLITPVDDSVAPASVDRGVCFASFDPLTEAMRRPIATSSPRDVGTDGQHKGDDEASPSFPAGCAEQQMPLLSDKDVRRHVHDALRRFYPFIKCQVHNGQVVLRYTPKPGPKNTTDSTAPSNESVLLGVRRPREAEGEATKADLNADLPSGATSDFVHFIVRKRNLDTAEMRQLVGEYCKLKDGSVCAAGMKDKKAVTTQRCSIPNTKTPSMSQVGCSSLAASTPASPIILRWPADPQNSYATVLCAAPRSGPVHLGQLKGNWFLVLVRHVRWAMAGERRGWGGDTAGTQATQCEEPQNAPVCRSEEEGTLRTFLEERFSECVEYGFVNYFGQQRFGETIEHADDHTGVHLFAGRWVDAVRSLFRACPDVYDAFPEKMEARFVPGSSRDAQVMTHALRQTYRMYFSEHPLTRADVQTFSALWTRLCEKAITEGVAYYLRSLWVHAGQSVFFNLAASFIVDGMQRPPPLCSANGERRAVPTSGATESVDSPLASTPAPASTAATADGLPPLPYATVAKSYLPLGGYQVDRAAAEEGTRGGEENSAAWQGWREAAIEHALRTLRWTEAQAFEQRKVAGVPVPGSWRAVVVRPRDAVLEWMTNDEVRAEAQLSDTPATHSQSALPSMRLSFALPSSTYATVFLREVLGCDKWW
ncbi:hypothetical protein ABB37_01415 [Leptomonas pyrrhocoris]|uniref:TRUD domain-containing protein n=1 Tax=Leptomonas pyrrhocoris TaxID=157538 RepID=A0A0M9G8Z6_LEPPY|nr:hypothetical protein ABB37_01415 [Leptomonas pyrrhocoris]KPA84979.1 hypothetical protein ABB37_01415 [Leptomonas pyrrhocoris]|eukprot:XP_015663418.1 hypothetical protein ABB37_01415 [Leptomonas pyrrhocoris]